MLGTDSRHSKRARSRVAAQESVRHHTYHARAAARSHRGDCQSKFQDSDILYFKADESNRPDYEARGMGPFQPYGEDGETMGA